MGFQGTDVQLSLAVLSSTGEPHLPTLLILILYLDPNFPAMESTALLAYQALQTAVPPSRHATLKSGWIQRRNLVEIRVDFANRF